MSVGVAAGGEAWQLVGTEVARFDGSFEGAYEWDGCRLTRTSLVRLTDDLATVRAVQPGDFTLQVNLGDEAPSTVSFDACKAAWLVAELTAALAVGHGFDLDDTTTQDSLFDECGEC